MKKYFNVTGLIIPEKHFYAPVDKIVNKIFDKIVKKEYFVIQKPRQYGKTTTILLLNKFLNKRNDYLCISISFADYSHETWLSEEYFCNSIIFEIYRNIKYSKVKQLLNFIKKYLDISKLSDLSLFITELNKISTKKIVFIINEFDTGIRYNMLINFLAMLRGKYLSAQQYKTKTFHSVILAVFKDVQTIEILNIEDCNRLEKIYSWNIASEFNIEMELKSNQIEMMLLDYKRERNVNLNSKLLSEKIFYWTSGYPYLVSGLCKIMDEDLLPKKSIKQLDLNDLVDAINLILYKQIISFTGIMDLVRDNQSIYNLVERIIFSGEKIKFSLRNSIIKLAFNYGILRKESYYCKIHNRIYEQRIYNYFISKYQTDRSRTIASDLITNKYIDKNNDLILDQLLIDFQELVKSKYSSEYDFKSDEFLKNQVRLLFIVFFQPLLYNKGFAFYEVETSIEKRMDILIIYNNKKYLIELKLYYEQEYHNEGLDKLNDYLNSENITKFFLLLFDMKSSTQITAEETNTQTQNSTLITNSNITDNTSIEINSSMKKIQLNQLIQQKLTQI